MYKNKLIPYLFVLSVIFYTGHGQSNLDPQNITETNETVETTVTGTPETTSVITSTVTPTPNISCETHNNDCKGCVENTQCYYCSENNRCFHHIEKIILDKDCDISHAYFYTCKANVKVMMIIIGVLCAIPILVILIVCCYCCCKRKGIKISKDDLKWARQREERKQIAAERRKERAERTEEIRKKYGLVKDANPYQRFDA